MKLPTNKVSREFFIFVQELVLTHETIEDGKNDEPVFIII